MKHVLSLSTLFVTIMSSNAFVQDMASIHNGNQHQRRPFLRTFDIDSNLEGRQQQQHSSRSHHQGSHRLWATIVPPESIQQAWNSYNDALETNPLLVKSITASVILGAADLAGQALESATKKELDDGSDSTITTTSDASIDFARTARFAFFGLVLQAPWNHVYYQILDGAIPPTEDPFTPTTAVKTVIDQFVQAPIFTVLIFAFLGFLEGKTYDDIKKQLEDDYADTMVANWKLWVPATVVNLAFVPPILRVLYLNVVFFFWSIFLSLKLNKEEGSSA